MSNNKVILEPISENNHSFLFYLYSLPGISGTVEEEIIYSWENASQFGGRLKETAHYIFTIRPADHPALIIGICMVYRRNDVGPTFEIRCRFLPEYMDRGFLSQAIALATAYVKAEFENPIILVDVPGNHLPSEKASLRTQA